MNTPDVVVGILDPYINRFELWNNTGRLYNSGDPVPAVGMAASYSIQLPSPEEAARVFLQVQEGRISNVMARQALEGRSVFDPRGRYLGCGGQELEPLSLKPPKPPVDIITAVTQMNRPVAVPSQPAEALEPPAETSTVPELIEELKTLPEPAITAHTFHLRPNFEIEVKLPDDLTKHEVKRFALFLSSLPYGHEDESRL